MKNWGRFPHRSFKLLFCCRLTWSYSGARAAEGRHALLYAYRISYSQTIFVSGKWLAGDYVRTTVKSRKMAPILVSSCIVYLCNLILEIYIMVNWQLSNQSIRWPVPHDHIASSGWNSSRSSIFVVDLWKVYGFSLNCGLKYFHKLLKWAKNRSSAFRLG